MASFASITLISPQSRTVRLSAEHCYGLDTWCNGVKVVSFSGVAVQPYNPISVGAFTLAAGANVIIFKLTGASTPQASFAFSDAAGAALTDVRYMIDTCGGETPLLSVHAGAALIRPDQLTLRVTRSTVDFAVSGSGAYRIALVSPEGRVVKTIQGMGSRTWRVPTRGIGTGVYFVNAQVGSKRLVTKIFIRQGGYQ